MDRIDSFEVTPSTVSKVIFVLAVCVTMVTLPYLFDAPRAISRSYISGFSNRAAIILLFLGTALFAVFTRGKIANQSADDSKLGVRTLLIGLLLTLMYCLRFCKITLSVLSGGEAHYFTNRAQLLLSGIKPFTQFEFAYGPLLLYPIVWVQRLFHLQTLQAYDIVWLIFWQLGVFMIWIVLRGINFPVPYRGMLFALLVAMQLAFANNGGLSYTPFRAYFSSFCIVLTYQIWTYTRNSWLTALSVICFSALSIGCSMDQAVGVAIGTLAIMVLLWLSPEHKFSGSAFGLAAVGIFVCFYFAHRMNLTASLRSFGGGGYSYPLLPSPAIFLVLSAYIIAGCVFPRMLYVWFFKPEKETRHSSAYLAQLPVAIPLTLAGCFMIPNALGRCDVLHITAAIPAFVVGATVIFSIPGLRRWWLPSACLGLILMPMNVASSLRHLLVKPSSQTKMQEAQSSIVIGSGSQKSTFDNQTYVSSSDLAESQLPCDQRYFSPSFMPVSTDKFLPQCLDTGYYLGLANVSTVKTIQFKVEELKEHSLQPLLMENTPLEAQLPLQLASNRSLYYESESIWVPPLRNAPLTYAPIIDYIRGHYVQGPILANGRLRIWYPVGSLETRAITSD